MPSGGNYAQIIHPHANNVTWMELSASPQLRLTVDSHLTASDHGLGVGSARGGTGKLEQLAKADHVAGDLDQLLHTESVSRRIRRDHPESCPHDTVCVRIAGGKSSPPESASWRNPTRLAPGPSFAFGESAVPARAFNGKHDSALGPHDAR